MVPTLLKPKLWSLKNRLKSTLANKASSGRDMVLAIFAVIVMVSIFNGSTTMLEKIHQNMHLAYFPPSLPLGMILILLFVMLLFSTAVTALGTLYLSKDLDLVLSSPIPFQEFFSAKLVYVLFSSSWMAFIFGLPAILAFGNSYSAGWEYYAMVVAALIPYFTIPTLVSLLLVTVFCRIIPAGRTREIVMLICILGLGLLYLLARVISPAGGGLQTVNDVLHLVSMLSVSHQSWLPSYWASAILGEALKPEGVSFFPYIAALYGTTLTLGGAAYLVLRSQHFVAFSKTRSNRNVVRLKSKKSHHWFVKMTPFLDPQYRSLLVKEYKIFSRDMTQAVQLLLLLGLCMIYLYNFRVLHAVKGLPEGTRVWWQGFLVIANLAMGAFVTTAVCTRFVFPSVSLEGKSFWTLRTAPMTLGEILRAKFWAWLVPVASMSSIIFASGAFAIDAEPHIVVINALSSWIICYGIVGLGIGMGASFANFHWEHSSQLAASFGSLLYMLSSAILIMINMLPAALLIFLRTLRDTGYVFSVFEWYVCVGSAAILLAYFNFAATRWAIQLGENSLEGRLA